jgi:DNA-binding CsgD family transcriptional regulator
MRRIGSDTDLSRGVALSSAGFRPCTQTACSFPPVVIFLTKTLPLRLRPHRTVEPRTALLLRVWITHACVVSLCVAYLALSPLMVGWPITPTEGVELVAWFTGLLLADYLALRWVFRRQRPSRRYQSDLGLTAREVEIVRLIADGYTAKEIAETLCISPKTVDAHRGHILRKLGVKDRVGLTRYAIRRGLVDP